jgi:hypothetical protein
MKAKLKLKAWARWCASGKPLSFSLYGDSVFERSLTPRHHDNSATDVPLWRDAETDWLHTLDGRLHGALSAQERRVLLAAVAPLGRVAGEEERAAAAGVSPAELNRVKREALHLAESIEAD